MRRFFIIVFFLSCLVNNMFSQQRPTLNRESIKKEQYKRNKAKQTKAQKGNVQKKVAEVGRTYTQSKKNVVKKRSESAHYDNSLNTALTVSTTSVSATSEATSRYITVYGNSDWYIDGNYSNWIHASKSDDNLYVYIDANNSTQSRSDYIIIRSGNKTCNINISQSGIKSANLNVSSSYLNFSNNGGTQTINIESNYDWNIDIPHLSWLHTNKSGNQLYVSVDKNNSTQSRSDYFSISNGYKSVNISISQTGKPAYINVSASDVSFSSDGGTRTIHVDANCDWNINVPIASWGSLSTTGNSITIKIKPNNSSSQRTDYFTIKGGGIQKRVNITQTASYSSYNYSNSNYSKENKNIWDSDYKPSYSYYSNKSSESLFSIGVDGDFETNLGSKSGYQMFYSVGLLIRLGQPKHTFNFITGVRYRWYRVMPSYDSYYDDGSDDWQYFGGAMGIPTNFRFNIAHFGENAAMFIGLGAEFGVYLADEKHKNSMEKNYMSFSPQFGFTSRHFDISAYWRRYQKGIFVDAIKRYSSEFDSSNMIGLQMGFYF